MPILWQLLALSLTQCLPVSAATNNTNPGKPLNIQPSQFWDGNDGPWSTFRIAVGGSTAQQIRVLPASSQSSSLFVLTEACDNVVAQAGKTCENERGGIYFRNSSNTWKESGTYAIDTWLEQRVGLAAHGLFGFDDVSLGWTGDGLPTLTNQSIVGVRSPSFQLGALALSPKPVNFTDYNNPIPSLLQNLRNMPTPIPSLSWSYTAGAYNLAPKVFGSLVLGGYDTTRFKPNNLTFPFGADISLDLQVAIQRITVNGTNDALLSSPIISYISTLIPDIWLPIDACSQFSKTFGLSFNETSKDYYINNTSHQQNLNNNPVVTFQVGPDASGASTNIQLPYWNFYLAAQKADVDPATSNGMLRFPIRRASNDTQYVLGRTFLQSAYLSADYERQHFNLSQALYPSSSVKQNIVAILPPGFSNPPGDTSSSKNGLGTGMIAGIAVGAVALIAFIAVSIFLCLRRKKAKKKNFNELEDTDVQNTTAHEMTGEHKRHEVQDGLGMKHEMVGDSDPRIELSAGAEQQKPAEAADTGIMIYELPAEEKKMAEMEGEGHVKEIG
ncbi:aspartic peptidase domain-containing protein [Phaeosphaeriaceae sp. PMI808]|nr:aspartic peptidase domain-containing protein [Phaeosphaeriaceae sp. PMI808]